MFPTKENPFTVTTELSVKVTDGFHEFISLSSDRLFSISHGDKTTRCPNHSVPYYLKNNNLVDDHWNIKDGVTVEVDINEIAINKKYNLNITPFVDNNDGDSFQQTFAAIIALPVGTVFYVTYVKYGKTLSKNTGVKIKITKCPEKGLINKTLYLDCNFLDNFSII